MIPNAGILWKYEKICSDTSIYTEFHAGVDSDGQNPSKIYQKSQNHAEITKFRYYPTNLNIFSRRFQKSQSQHEKLAPHVEKSMISKFILFVEDVFLYIFRCRMMMLIQLHMTTLENHLFLTQALQRWRRSLLKRCLILHRSKFWKRRRGRLVIICQIPSLSLSTSLYILYVWFPPLGPHMGPQQVGAIHKICRGDITLHIYIYI